jgi:23S rRNA (guanosine2251-2'-O)-methyltransferase
MPRWIYGKHAILERLQLERSGLSQVVLAKGQKPAESAALLRAAEAAQVRVEWRERKWLDERAGGGKHQGVIAAAEEFKYVELADLLEASQSDSLVMVLDGVEDPGNLGAVLRSAECAGALGLIIPKDRAAQVTPLAEKASAGAAGRVPVASVTNVSRALEDLKKAGYWIYGLAGEAKDSLFAQDFSGKVCLVCGAEGQGLRPLVARNCDALLKIPMQGQVASLNVSVAAALALFEVSRKR